MKTRRVRLSFDDGLGEAVPSPVPEPPWTLGLGDNPRTRGVVEANTSRRGTRTVAARAMTALSPEDTKGLNEVQAYDDLSDKLDDVMQGLVQPQRKLEQAGRLGRFDPKTTKKLSRIIDVFGVLMNDVDELRVDAAQH